MGNLVIKQNLITKENAPDLIKICPFNAITYENDKLEINAACKMCKLCVKKSGGLIEYVE